MATSAQSPRHFDHTNSVDEQFEYRGNVAAGIARDFLTQEPRLRLVFLKGFTACGKTRTSKEVAREIAKGLHGVDEAHTFYFDLKRIDSDQGLLRDMSRDVKRYVHEWKSDAELSSCADLCRAFEDSNNGVKRMFILVMDNVDAVRSQDVARVLMTCTELVGQTSNVLLVVTSLTKLNFVRIRVMHYEMEPMDCGDAKLLLKETSGNPDNLDEHADKIVGLVNCSPLALVITGYQMNKEHFPLPFSPSEMIELLEDSTCLALGLPNVPEEDKLCERIKDIVTENYHVLEMVVIAYNYPQGFDPDELMIALNHMPPAQVKRTILHVLLNGSIYRLCEGKGEGAGCELKSASILVEVLKETFWQMTSKDKFVTRFNKDLAEAVEDQSLLMTSQAKELRHAEIHLLQQQKNFAHKRPKLSSEDLKALRMNVITKGAALVNEIKRESFVDCCKLNLNGFEEPKTNDAFTKAVQVSTADHETTPSCKEPEACVSPTFSSDLPDLTRVHQAHLKKKLDDLSKAYVDIQKKKKDELEQARKKEKGLTEILSEKICDSKDRAPPQAETNDGSKPDVWTEEDSLLSKFRTLSSQDEGTNPSSVVEDTTRTCPKTSLSAQAHSLHSSSTPASALEDIKEVPVLTEKQSTYSCQSTIRACHKLTDGKTDNEEVNGSGREAVESEYDWDIPVEKEAQIGDGATNGGTEIHLSSENKPRYESEKQVRNPGGHKRGSSRGEFKRGAPFQDRRHETIGQGLLGEPPNVGYNVGPAYHQRAPPHPESRFSSPHQDFDPLQLHSTHRYPDPRHGFPQGSYATPRYPPPMYRNGYPHGSSGMDQNSSRRGNHHTQQLHHQDYWQQQQQFGNYHPQSNFPALSNDPCAPSSWGYPPLVSWSLPHNEQAQIRPVPPPHRHHPPFDGNQTAHDHIAYQERKIQYYNNRHH